jgi:ribose-phosphate pyrophosphokinase
VLNRSASPALHVPVSSFRTWERKYEYKQERQEEEPSNFQIRSRLTLAALLMGGSALAWTQISETASAFGGQDDESFAHAPRFQDLLVFSGTANPELSADICRALGVPQGKVKVKKFNDGEIGIRVNENVRGKDCYIVQPTCPPDVNDHVMELLLMVSTLRRASAGNITVVIPYYGYARQDRKMQSRVPISAADMARLLESMGVDRVVAVDLHCGQIQGFFSPNVPVDNLEGHVVGLSWFKKQNLDPALTKVVSPDAGGVYRAKQFREGLDQMGMNAGLAMIIKQRAQDTTITNMDLVGEVEGCDVIMVDDMIDTAGTLTKAAAELKRMGAKRVYAFATHGLFSGPAFDRIKNSCLEKVVVTNSIPLQPGAPDNILQLSVADLLAESIARIHLHKSVSILFYHKGGE